MKAGGNGERSQEGQGRVGRSKTNGAEAKRADGAGSMSAKSATVPKGTAEAEVREVSLRLCPRIQYLLYALNKLPTETETVSKLQRGKCSVTLTLLLNKLEILQA